MTDLLLTLISAVLISNLIVQLPLGIAPVLKAAAGSRAQLHALGLATTWLMFTVTLLNHLLYQYLLLPLELTALRLFVFLPTSLLLIKPSLVLLARLFPKLNVSGLWPLLASNAGILGLALLDAQTEQSLARAGALGLGAGLGFWLLASLYQDLRQRISHADVPQPFRGLPIELISAGLLGVAFLGFNGLIAP